MAFTAWELIRGALITYACFLPLTWIPFLVMFAGGLLGAAQLGTLLDPEVAAGVVSLWVFMLLPSATWGLAALVPAALVALAIGLALRRVAPRSVHVLAHAAWGLVVGVVVSGLVLGVWSFAQDSAGIVPTLLAYGVAVGAAAALGWWATSTLALRRDAAQASR